MTTEKHLEDIREIRSIMERSTRFLSLSGLSGVMAGIYALLGAYFAYDHFIETSKTWSIIPYFYDMWTYYAFYLADAALVVLFSIGTGILLTARRARTNGQTLWDRSALRLLFSVFFPLIVGGILCFAMLYHREEVMIAPIMLIFYGLGLISAANHTVGDIRNLGFVEVGLGVIAAFVVNHGLLFWSLGFGVMHIVYGIYMYFKYERKIK